MLSYLSFRRFVGALFVVSVVSCATATAQEAEPIKPATTLPDTTPWDLVALSEVPAHRWISQEGDMHKLLYSGLAYDGEPTEVFAYYASPATLSGESATENGFPAVVLVHGGGGTAFDQWARLWAERGYAAIAMDLAGHGEGGQRLPNGGPNQDDATKFGAIDLPVTEQWSYHAVASVILGHSLIRSFAEVDAERTAVTGISWGGYLTCIVAGLDNRFKAAVPVYGCGYLHEGSAWDDRFAAMTPEQRDKWVMLWDPSQYVGSASMPMFFVNGTNDFAYWLESYAKTYDRDGSERNFRITVNMPHGHGAGWDPKEIGLFVDEHLIDGKALPTIGEVQTRSTTVAAQVSAAPTLKAAALHYTTDDPPHVDRTWTTVEAPVAENRISAEVPAAAKIWFFTVTDERGAIVSSKLVFR